MSAGTASSTSHQRSGGTVMGTALFRVFVPGTVIWPVRGRSDQKADPAGSV